MEAVRSRRLLVDKQIVGPTAFHMAQSDVSSCVLSIITSFTSGLDVFKKFRELGKSKGGDRKRQRSTRDQEEQHLVRSLRKGPEDIDREYQRSIAAVGDGFACGDGEKSTHRCDWDILTVLASCYGYSTC